MATTETRATGAWDDDAAPLVVENPATGRRVGTVPVVAPSVVSAIAAQLRAAQPEWEAAGPRVRAHHLRNWLDWIFDNEDRLLTIVQEEAGKSWGDTKIETMVAAEVINYYTKHAEAFLADRAVRPHGPAGATKRLKVFHRPFQLVGLITPWNYPLGMPMLDAPAALMAGAAVLSKPSEVTPLAWAECVRGFREEIGAPPVLACATGAGETGAAVVDEVDMVMFTGSTGTGRRIAMRAAERLIPCSLELGGKDAMIVLDDADIDRAVGAAVWSGFFNAGQACISIERVYVHDAVYEEFVHKLAERAQDLRVGSDPKGAFTYDYGALANETQMAIVERHVQDAIARGARAVTGGRRTGDGLFYEPTVLVDVDHDMACMREETFGPTLPVMRVADDDEAVRLANDSPYGLNGSVWTCDPERAERVARRMETGGVSANNCTATLFQFNLPFGGWKQSGLGSRLGGRDGLLKYCRQQAYTNERFNVPSELHWYPYTKRRGKLMARMVRLLGAHDWRRRLGRGRA